jgi:hypothetical protein
MKRYSGETSDQVMDLFGVISRYIGIHGSEILDDCIDSAWEDAVLELAEIIKARRMLDRINRMSHD